MNASDKQIKMNVDKFVSKDAGLDKAALESFENKNGVVTALGKLVFNRQKYGVAWVHFMKDMILSDDISIKVNLLASTKL